MRESLAMLGSAVAAAAMVGFGLHRWGGPEGRPWALPAGLALLIGGVGYSFYLPSWVNAVTFILVLFLLHQGARTRLERAVRGNPSLEVPEAGVRLRSMPDPAQLHSGVWMVENIARLDSSISASGGASPFAPRPAPVPEAPVASVTMTLDFVGETEDDYSVVLQAKAPCACPGVVVCHHREAQGEALKVLADPEEIRDIPGLTHDIVVRAMPMAFGFRLLDLPTLALVSDVLALRKEGREVYLHVSGPDLRVVSSSIFERDELPRLLSAAARLLGRMRFVGAES